MFLNTHKIDLMNLRILQLKMNIRNIIKQINFA